jgi:hypothetical protein
MNLQSCLFASAFFFSSLPGQAAPSPEDKALAKTLYQQASDDMERGNYARACPQFEAALQLDPEHIRTAMTLGMCEDHWGKLVKAQSRYAHARDLADAQNASDKIKEIDALMTNLKERIPKLRLIVPEQVAELDSVRITRNDKVVDKDFWGREIAVDPGLHVIQASAAGGASWKQEVQVKVRQTISVKIGLSIENDSRAKDSATPVGPYRKLGFAGLGVGAAGIVAGSIFGGLAISKNSASDDGHCNVNNRCDLVGTALRRDAQTFGNTSTAFFIVGGVLLTGGIVLIASSPSSNKQGAAQETAIRVGLGHVQLEKAW